MYQKDIRMHLVVIVFRSVAVQLGVGAGVAAEEGTGRFLARGGGDAHWRFVLPAPR